MIYVILLFVAFILGIVVGYQIRDYTKDKIHIEDDRADNPFIYTKDVYFAEPKDTKEAFNSSKTITDFIKRI